MRGEGGMGAAMVVMVLSDWVGLPDSKDVDDEPNKCPKMVFGRHGIHDCGPRVVM